MTNSKRTKLLLRSGWNRNENGEYDDAQLMFQKALQLEPQNLRIHFGLAMSLFWRGNFDDARFVFQLLCDKDPKNPTYQKQLELSKLLLDEIQQEVQHDQVLIAARFAHPKLALVKK